MSPQRTAIVIVASTRAAAGIYDDRSGPIAVDFLRRKGFDCPDARIVPDADIAATVSASLATSARKLRCRREPRQYCNNR